MSSKEPAKDKTVVNLDQTPRKTDEPPTTTEPKQRKKKKDVKKDDDELVDDEKDDVADETAEDFHPEEGHSSLCAIVTGVLCFPITLLGSCYCVQENEEAVLLSCGRYSGTVRDPGIHFANLFGREIITISKAKLSTDIPHTKVIDKDGNPVMVSGVVFYHFKDTKKAALDILDRQTFVADQAAIVLKQIVSHYPYDNHDVDTDDDSDEDDVPCLKRDTDVIVKHLVKELQKIVVVAGARIDSFKFNEISYAPEIAASLLKKQQASAIVASRHTLVDGAVRIATAAVNRLDKKGVGVDAQDKSRLISNLLTVVCADEHVQPVILLGST